MDTERMKVLVVDDGPTMRRALVGMLGELGFRDIDEAQNGVAALVLLKDKGGAYDLVFTDWNMPEMNGIELVQAMRNLPELDTVPVIMVTTRKTDKDLVQALDAGVTDYLVRPYAPPSLGKKIDTVLRSGATRMAEVYGTADIATLLQTTSGLGTILSQEEIDAHLSAAGAKASEPGEERRQAAEAAGVQQQDDAGSGAQKQVGSGSESGGDSGAGGPEKAPQERIVTSYDFRHPARVNKDQLRTLENLHDNFARLLSSTFSGAMRAVVDVDTAFVDQTTYAEFIMSLSNPSCSYQFTLGPTSGQAIIDIAMPVVFAGVDRIFGGKGASAGQACRQLTPIEMGVINRIAKRIIEDLEATWEPIVQAEITDIELETNPEFMQITAASEIVILLAFEVNSTNASGLISLCYPFFTLEPILPLLGMQSYVPQRPPRNQDQLLRDNRLRLGAMEVELAAELGRTRISLDDARSLQAGDVLRLPTRTRDPLTVSLGGKPKFLGHPVTDEQGGLQVKLAGPIPAECRAGYR